MSMHTLCSVCVPCHALCVFHAMQIIQVNLTMDKAVLCVEGAKLDFTYAVTWHPTSVSFEDRFQRYLDNGFFEHKVSREGRQKFSTKLQWRFHRLQFLRTKCK